MGNCVQEDSDKECVACGKLLEELKLPTFSGLFGEYCNEKCWYNVEGPVPKTKER